MRIGVHLVMWQSNLRSPSPSLLRAAALAGFGAVELSLVEMETVEAESLRQVADDLGIGLSCSFSLPPALDIASDDERVAEAGTGRLEEAVDLAAELGSKILVGPWYGGFGITACNSSERTARRARSAERVSRVAAYSRERHVVLGLEPLNRYETDLINTVDQARSYIEHTGSSNIGICLDTFHANIEEVSISSAIKASGSLLVHLHCAANHRGIPGTGSVDWESVFDAIRDQQYGGWCIVEVVARTDTELAERLRVWRRLCPPPHTAARRSAEFLRDSIGQV